MQQAACAIRGVWVYDLVKDVGLLTALYPMSTVIVLPYSFLSFLGGRRLLPQSAVVVHCGTVVNLPWITVTSFLKLPSFLIVISLKPVVMNVIPNCDVIADLPICRHCLPSRCAHFLTAKTNPTLVSSSWYSTMWVP